MVVYGLEVNKRNSDNIEVNMRSFEGLKYSPSKMDMTWEVSAKERNKLDYQTFFSDAYKYSQVRGVTTFRGNNYRNSATYGKVQVNEEKLEIVWVKPIGRLDKWTGVGWNGQPAIIEWDYDLLQKMNITEEKKSKRALKEVIYSTLDGNVYFLDLEDGKQTRNAIDIGAPIKGSVSIDPRGYPLLFVGQGIDTVHEKEVEIGYRIFELYDQKLLLFLNGKDNFAFRDWGAFDSNPLIDQTTDTMFIGGENGLFYQIKLNTNFQPAESKVTIKPKVMKYRYKVPGKNHQGIENSIAIYKNFAYFADNSGLLQALNINSLEPLWIRDVIDDTDSTVVIDANINQIALFTGCEVDHQGAEGKAYIRKIDAMTGETLWEKGYKAFYHPTVNGGILATPAVGINDISDLVIYNIARVGGLSKGLLVALDKETGVERWSIELRNYSWSSPVDIYTPEGKGYLIIGDSAGNLLMIDAKTGKVLDCINLGANIEGSPTVFNNMLVVGTRGQKIYGVKIK